MNYFIERKESEKYYNQMFINFLEIGTRNTNKIGNSKHTQVNLRFCLSKENLIINMNQY